MAEYRIKLDAYAGPLDLLLYLVKRREVDLQDIPMAELTADYVAHLRVIQELRPTLDVEAVAEFLLMAATLVEIKSQTLVPRPEGEEAEAVEGDAEGDEKDPRFELVQQLLAYKKYKDAAGALEARGERWSRRYPAAASGQAEAGVDGGDEPVSVELEDVDLMDLCRAFATLIDSLGPGGVKRRGEHAVTYDDTPISLHAADIEDRLRRAASEGGEEIGLTLRSLLEGRSSRAEMIGVFLACLELVRQRRVRIAARDQASAPPPPPTADELRLELRPGSDHLAADTDPSASQVDGGEQEVDPETGEPLFDWPDERGRRRYERRQRIRAARAAQGDFEGMKQVEVLDDEDEAFDDDELECDEETGADGAMV